MRESGEEVKHMLLKEIIQRVMYSFFVIFTCSAIVMSVCMLLVGYSSIFVGNFYILLCLALLTSVARFIFYSKKELNKRQMLIRNIIHFCVIQAIVMSAATFMGWVLWQDPISVFLMIGLVTLVYIAERAIEGYRAKRLADRLTQKLRNHYKNIGES